MSHDYPSSNPFRRKGASSGNSAALQEAQSTIDYFGHQQMEPTAEPTANIESTSLPKKSIKKVRVQSPHSPPAPKPLALLDEPNSLHNRRPTPIPGDNPPFDNFTLNTFDDEKPIQPSPAPPNPFNKTLETIENSVRVTPAPPTSAASPGRASMDVDAFKRLLMTGSTGTGPVLPTPQFLPDQLHYGAGDGEGHADAASSLPQSAFGPIQEAQRESPRTLHEISEPEYYSRRAEVPHSTSSRKKPPPPSSRHGRLIKVELRDNSHSMAAAATARSASQPSTPDLSDQQQYFGSASSTHVSPKNLNKPLPPAPDRTSQDSERESIFDREAAGKVPEPPSPPHSMRRKTPPPPPLARRRSHRLADSRPARIDREWLPPSLEEDPPSTNTQSIVGIEPTNNEGRSRSNSGRAPPPPPSRRPASIRGSSQQSSLPDDPSLHSPSPTLPPARGSPAGTLTPDRSSSIATDTGTNKRVSMLSPPPPPPHRHVDSSRRTSGELSRRSEESARSESRTHGETHEDRPDILADLTKLQREIDALRSRGDRSAS